MRVFCSSRRARDASRTPAARCRGWNGHSAIFLFTLYDYDQRQLLASEFPRRKAQRRCWASRHLFTWNQSLSWTHHGLVSIDATLSVSTTVLSSPECAVYCSPLFYVVYTFGSGLLCEHWNVCGGRLGHKFFESQAQA